MVRSRLPIALFLSAALAWPALAATKDGNFSVRGIAAQNCTTLVGAVRQNSEVAEGLLHWLMGYLTAFNRIQSETFDVSPLEGLSMLRMILGTCEQAPEALVETVAFDVLKALSAARVVAATPEVETTSGDHKAKVRRETLQRIQAQLIRLGHLSGTADGKFGPQTSAALSAFQASQNLPQTGVADAATVVRILIELPSQNQ